MPSNGEDAVERIRRDHAQMLQLIDRIRSQCTQRAILKNCNECDPVQRGVCHGNIEQLIRSFVETTLKHNLIESMYMEERVPSAHRIAHNQAHMEIALQLKAIRVVFSEDGNCILAIEGIDHIHQTLLAHLKDYDRQLESYLLEANLAPQA
jgi:hemerythrin